MTTVHTTIALRIKEAREKLGWTQSKLGLRAGVLPRSISYWEQGRGEPSITAAIKLASAMAITLDQLFGKESDLTGYIRTTCPECLYDTKVPVEVPLPKAGFPPTEWVCPDCGAVLIVRDEHQYSDERTVSA